MWKDYKKWHGVKTVINNQAKNITFNERDIWLCYIGENVGSEQDGKGKYFTRPILILKKFNNQVFWSLPLTTSEKQNEYHFEIYCQDGKFNFAILSQIRLLDSKRLIHKIRILSKKKFRETTEKLKGLIP